MDSSMNDAADDIEDHKAVSKHREVAPDAAAKSLGGAVVVAVRFNEKLSAIHRFPNPP
jgi:hypothetical protein